MSKFEDIHDPDDYSVSQVLSAKLRADSSNGIVYNSVRFPEGRAIALFWPDVAGVPMQGQHYSYYWDGTRVTRVKNLGSGDVFEIVEESSD